MIEPTAPEQNPTTPKRIQMSRQHPWRADNPDAVIVARPSKWGNPYLIGVRDRADNERTVEDVVRLFRISATQWWGPGYLDHVRADLAGKDLACWCPLDQPCHADVLLDLANGGAV